MARYQIIFAYDGTQFVGSQRQAQSRTVQSVLEHALRQLGWDGRSILLAGRTDSGVHASGQVAAADLEWKHSEDELQKALNSHLPRDMAVNAVRIVDDRFHPRFDAISRHYRYRLYFQPIRDPLRERFYGRVWPQGDRSLIRTAADLLKGTHDFAAFGSPPRSGGNTVRTVTKAKWEFSGDVWTFDVQADAFLYRMVRRMVFTQTAVAQGKITLDQFQKAILEQSKLPAGLATPSGLTLVEVKYEKDEQLVK
jgi:tRNA pseudouridine38-40 synthase